MPRSHLETRCIITLAAGHDAGRMFNLADDFLCHYARRCRADLVVRRGPAPGPPVFDPFASLMYLKLDLMREALATHDRALWLDADTLVRPDCPILFDLVPPTHWAGYEALAATRTLPDGDRHVRDQLDHLGEVCRQEGLPIPDSRGRYFNCGVQLASKSHAFLYAPPVEPDGHGWGEQSRVNARLFSRPDVPVYHLADPFNSMSWFHRGDYLETAWIVHYCGGGSPGERLDRMSADAAAWRSRYRLKTNTDGE